MGDNQEGGVRTKRRRGMTREQNTFSDGYDSGGYKDDDEFTQLSRLEQVEHMNIIGKRLEERQMRTFYKEVAEKAQKTDGGQQIMPNTNILQQTSTAATASNNAEYQKRSQVDQDRIQHRKEIENRRERYAKDSTSFHHITDYSQAHVYAEDANRFASSSSSSAVPPGQHQRDKNAESEDFQKLVKQLTLPNDFLNKLILRSNFKELVKGAFVKAKIGMKYEIYRIEDVRTEGSVIFSLSNGVKRREIDLKFISNQGADSAELCTYYEQNHKTEVLSRLKEKKLRFDELLNKKQDKSEKQKFAEIDEQIQKKLADRYFEDAVNLSANELQTYIDFLRDRILEIDTFESNHQNDSSTSARKDLVEHLKTKKRYIQTQDLLSTKIKLVKHQFVPIFTKNVLEIGSKISQQALSKKSTKIKDKATIKKAKIDKLQIPYLKWENQFSMLSTHSTATAFKQDIIKNHQKLTLSPAITQSYAHIDTSDAAIALLLAPQRK